MQLLINKWVSMSAWHLSHGCWWWWWWWPFVAAAYLHLPSNWPKASGWMPQRFSWIYQKVQVSFLQPGFNWIKCIWIRIPKCWHPHIRLEENKVKEMPLVPLGSLPLSPSKVKPASLEMDLNFDDYFQRDFEKVHCHNPAPSPVLEVMPIATAKVLCPNPLASTCCYWECTNSY